MVTTKLTFLALLLGATAAMIGCLEREKVSTPPVTEKATQKIAEATPAGRIPVIARYLPEGYLPGTLKSFDNDKDLLAAYGFSSDKNILNLSKSSEMTVASYSENGQDTIFIVKYPDTASAQETLSTYIDYFKVKKNLRVIGLMNEPVRIMLFYDGPKTRSLLRASRRWLIGAWGITDESEMERKTSQILDNIMR